MRYFLPPFYEPKTIRNRCRQVCSTGLSVNTEYSGRKSWGRDLDLDRHKNGKLDPDLDLHRNDNNPQHYNLHTVCQKNEHGVSSTLR